MRSALSILLCLIVLLSIGPTLAAQGRSSSTTLTVALSSTPRPMDPATAPTVEQAVFSYAAYENLVRRNRGEGASQEFLPERARSWDRSHDGLRWRFEISPGGRFGDGSAVDANAVAFSLKRLVALGRGPSSRAADVFESIEVVDAAHVDIVLSRPEPRLLAILADRAASIINPAILDHEQDDDWGSGWLSSRTAGSGPYQLVEGAGVGTYVLARNPHYPLETYFDRLIFREVKDPIARALGANRGEIDIAVLMPGPALRQAEGNPNVDERTTVTDAYQNIAFNLDRDVFSDVRLRKAVALSIDTEAIIQHIRGGRARPSLGPGGSSVPRYDLNAAQRLAREVLGANRPVVKMIYPGVSPDTDTVAQYVQAQLSQLGIQVRLERLSIGAYLSRIGRGAYDLVLSGFVATDSDPFAIADPWYNSNSPPIQNPARFDDPRVDALLAELRVTYDQDERTVLLREIADIVADRLPYVYLQQTVLSFLIQSDLQGFSLDPTAALDFPYAELRRAE